MKLTVRELMDLDLWPRYCELEGTSEWALNEGQVDEDEHMDMSRNTSIKLGLLKGELDPEPEPEPDPWSDVDPLQCIKVEVEKLNRDESGFVTPTELHLKKKELDRLLEYVKDD